MIAAFKQIPAPLQKQALIRLGIGAVFIMLLAVLLAAARDITLWLPCAGAAVFFAASAFALFRRAVLGEYVVATGVCRAAGQTALKRRAKYILLDTYEGVVRAKLHGRHQKTPAGAAVDLYIAKNTPIYPKDNAQMIYSYLAIDVLKNND